MVEKLIVQSIALKGLIPHGAKVLDLGTGVGIPGIPLKTVRSDISLTLAERSKKKVAFLVYITRKLGLDVSLIEGNLTGKERNLLGVFDTIISRGAGPKEKIKDLAFPLLKEGGTLILYSSASEDYTHMVPAGKGRMLHLRVEKKERALHSPRQEKDQKEA